MPSLYYGGDVVIDQRMGDIYAVELQSSGQRLKRSVKNRDDRVLQLPDGNTILPATPTTP